MDDHAMVPLPPDPSQVKRVLIVKLSSIGDVVHALPVSAALGDAFPHWKMTWVVESKSSAIVEGNPYLQEVLVLPDDWHKKTYTGQSLAHLAALRRTIRARQFDLAIDLQGVLRSALIAWLSGATYRFGYDWLRRGAWLFVTRVARRSASVHIVDQLLDVARFLGAPVPVVKFPLHIPLEDKRAAEEFLLAEGIAAAEPFVAINPTEGGAGRKGWGAERYVRLLDQLAQTGSPPVVLVGGTNDRALGEAIVAKARPRPGNLIGRTNLKQLAAILRRVALHICGDTGSAHLAAALGRPVVSIFGRSNSARLAPYGQGQRVLHHPEQCVAACRLYHRFAPLNSQPACFTRWPACASAVNVEEVAAAVRRCLDEFPVSRRFGEPRGPGANASRLATNRRES
jgi:heptosyltransferase-1